MRKRSLLLFLLMLAMLTGCGRKEPSEPTTGAPGPGESYVYSIDAGEFSGYMAGKVIEETLVEGKIGDVTLTAGWRNNTDGVWRTRESLRAEVYAISDVPKEVAVALKFLDKGDALTTTHCYVILNPEADLAPVAEYVIRPMAPNNPGDE